VVRSKRIRIYPEKETRSLTNRYFGLTRYWYNQAVEYLKTEGTKASLADVRKLQGDTHPEWALNSPQRIREHAFDDACEAVKQAKKKFRETGVFQEVSFRCRKDPVQRFGFDSQSLSADTIFRKKEFQWKFFSSECFTVTLEGTQVVRENGRYFLIIPERRCLKMPENQRHGDVALDPGVRTFLSFYSENVHGKIGQGDFKNIFRLCLNLDNLISRISKAKCKPKRNMRKAAQRLRMKIKDLVNDLHHKAAHFLVTRFDRIFLPTFETSQMVTKLQSKTARSMLSFAHYRFKQFLKAKAEEYSCEVLEVSEAWTSKTCSYCGRIHQIGRKKVLKCTCGCTVDRDLNGARGIYLRALGASPLHLKDSLLTPSEQAIVNLC